MENRLAFSSTRLPIEFYQSSAGAVAELVLVRRMLRSLCVATIALVCLGAAPSPVPLARHYTPEQWKAIRAKFTEIARPEYPALLRAWHFTGSGIFRMYINEDGRVTAIKILKSTRHPELDSEAVNTFIRWRAKPGPKWDWDIPITFTMSR